MIRAFSRKMLVSGGLGRSCSTQPPMPVSINAGGKLFTSSMSTLCDRFPQSTLASTVKAHVESSNKGTPLFVDVDSAVFDEVLEFLRSGIPSDSAAQTERFQKSLGVAVEAFGLEEYYSPKKAIIQSDNSAVVLPSVLFVQVSDSIQMDQGHKRHAITITFGADGFHLRKLCSRVRKSLNDQLSSTFWQCYQTNERAVFLVTSKLAGGTADLLTTTLSQCILEHTENDMGYELSTSTVALTPDIKNLNVRMFIHSYIFRKKCGSGNVGSAPTVSPQTTPSDDSWPE